MNRFSVLGEYTIYSDKNGEFVTYSDYKDKVAEHAKLNDELSQANDRQAAYIERLLYVIESEGLSVHFGREEADAAIAEIGAKAVEAFAEYIIQPPRSVENIYCEIQALVFAKELRGGGA